MFGVVLGGEFLVDLEHFSADDLEAFAFEAVEDFADEATLYAVGLDEDEGCFHVPGSPRLNRRFRRSLTVAMRKCRYTLNGKSKRGRLRKNTAVTDEMCFITDREEIIKSAEKDLEKGGEQG